MAVIRQARRHLGIFGCRHAADKVHHVVAVDGVIRRLAHAEVREGTAGEVQDVRPVVRIGLGDDLHRGALQHGDCIRRRRFDEIHLGGEQRRSAGRGLRHRQQHQPVLLRHARLVPVIVVRHQLHTFMRGHAGEAIGAGAGGLIGVGSPVVVQRLRPAAADHQHVGHVVRKQRFDEFRGDGDAMVVNLLDAVEVRQVGAGQGKLLREKLRRLGVADALEVPDDVVGSEVAAVMPLHALSQGEYPALVVGRIDMPLSREARLDVRRPVALRQIPVDQSVVQIPADEPKAFKALVWIARRNRQIARGHRHLQDAGRPGRRRGGDQPSSNEAGHCAAP